MKKIFLVLVIGLFASCKKEEPQPTGCNCYKAYEIFTQGSWQQQYDTASEVKPCEVDGTLTYEAANSRYTWICQ